MRPFLLMACVLVLCIAVSGQAKVGSISGAVTAPTGTGVAEAPIQVRNVATGVLTRTRSSESGRYTLSGLPEGTYVLTIALQCCQYESVRRDNIALQAGQAMQLDIRLQLGRGNFAAVDDPAAEAVFIRKRNPASTKPAPRLHDGKPDLSGLWLITDDPYPEDPPTLPWAEALVKERFANDLKDAPHVKCLSERLPVPSATPPFMGKFVQTPSLLVVLFEDVPGFRQIFLDGRSHPAPANRVPSWVGHSVGRWEKDTLVVDTVGFNDRGWISRAFPRTEQLRMTERYHRRDFSHLDAHVTFDDPGVFTRPWSRTMTWDLLPNEELMEYVCEIDRANPLRSK
jgi:hypothetical protein